MICALMPPPIYEWMNEWPTYLCAAHTIIHLLYTKCMKSYYLSEHTQNGGGGLCQITHSTRCNFMYDRPLGLLISLTKEVIFLIKK
jgi:hypothetical protein